ncbi:MAG: GIY-YIG nuclease family protein [Alcanivorax sp.]|nr:MAG: GIY-YIG nuclease family protein [Alcanivorax sp.]
MDKGFVYILKNKAFNSLLKIGFSKKAPEVRAKELSSTGVPSPYTVAYYCLTEQARSVESNLHRRLSAFRYSENREFFEIDLEAAVNCIRSLCTPEHEWSNEILIKSTDGTPLNLKILNYEVNGINIWSRRQVKSQIHEMVCFCELTKEKGLSHFITSMLYCSNSGLCSFEFSDEFEQCSEIANEIRQIARSTIAQFEWFGSVDHGEPSQ